MVETNWNDDAEGDGNCLWNKYQDLDPALPTSLFTHITCSSQGQSEKSKSDLISESGGVPKVSLLLNNRAGIWPRPARPVVSSCPQHLPVAWIWELLLGRKVMTNLDGIFKSRDITLPTKVHPVKAMVFPVVMYGCESWTAKNAERWRIDAFELWCWRRLLRVPWTARRSNQSILKEISPGISLEGMMLKLKLQYFGHLMRRVDSLEKTLMLGGIGGRRRRGWQRMR